MHLTKLKMTISEEYILYTFNHMLFWTRQNYGDSKTISDCQGLRGERAEWMEPRKFLRK